MKLSFSIPSKSSSKPSNPINNPSGSSTNHDAEADAPSKHFITEFDPSKPPTNSTHQIIIPPLQNQWPPHKKMNSLHLPITDPTSADQSLQFEDDTLSASEPGSHMSYGLNLRQTAKNNEDGKDEDNNRRVPVETLMLQKFKEDMKRLPDHQGFDEFKDVPVEDFGKALLAGYGWSEGMGIGKNAKEDVKVVQYKGRKPREGLGFVSDDGALVVGRSVRIVGGRDAGLKGSVVRRIGDDWVVLKISRINEEVKVRMNDVAELGSVEEERCLRKLKEVKIQGEDDKGLRGKRGEVE